MSNRPALVKQAEITRVVKGVKQAGIDVARVVVGPDGSIAVFSKGGAGGLQGNPWDQVE